MNSIEDHKDSASGSSEGGDHHGPDGPVRVPLPAIHRPYVIVIGLFGLQRVASIFLGSGDGIQLGLQFLALAAIFIHITWIKTLFRDGKAILGDGLPIDASRAVLALILSCIFAELLTAVLLWLLYRQTLAGIGDKDPLIGRLLARFAEDVRVLVILSIIDFVVSMVALFHVAGKMEGAGLEDTAALADPELLGTGGGLVLAVFVLTVSAGYLWFVVRATPVLYRAFMVAAKTPAT